MALEREVIPCVADIPEVIPFEGSQILLAGCWPLGFQEFDAPGQVISFCGLACEIDLGRVKASACQQLLLSSQALLFCSLAEGSLCCLPSVIDAESGAVIKTPPPRSLTRYFRQAHFYYFAGSWQVTLLLTFSALACLSAISGIYLNLTMWWRKRV